MNHKRSRSRSRSRERQNNHSRHREQERDSKKSRNETGKIESEDKSKKTNKDLNFEKLQEKLNKQLNKVASKDTGLKKGGQTWMRSDLNKFTYNDEPSQINYSEVRKLMDEEDFEYEMEKVQKAKVGTGDLNHAEAIFGKVSKADLRHVDVVDEKYASGTRADDFIPLKKTNDSKKEVHSITNASKVSNVSPLVQKPTPIPEPTKPEVSSISGRADWRTRATRRDG